MTPLQEVKSARKRALTMGVYSGWRHEYDSHFLAACLDNYTCCVDAEMSGERDFFEVLIYIWFMARRINLFCDSQLVKGDAAAEYWLERFLWRVDCVCDFGRL